MILFQVRQILSLCPNLTHLDLTQTDVSDSAFDRYRRALPSLLLPPSLLLSYLNSPYFEMSFFRLYFFCQTRFFPLLSLPAGPPWGRVCLWSTSTYQAVIRSLTTP